MTIIQIPELQERQPHIQRLFKIGENILNSDEKNFVLKFDTCNWIMPYGIAYLGGIVRFANQQGKQVEFDWSSVSNDIYIQMLARNGFMDVFGYETGLSSQSSIPYREYHNHNKVEIHDYLQNQWLGRGWLGISNSLNEAICGNMYEIFNNAFFHADSPIGIITIGQFYPNNNQIRLSVVDFGVGIPANVRNYHADKTMTDKDTLQWAFSSGNSTKLSQSKDDDPRGMGLDLLKEFVSINRGKMRIFSHYGYGKIEKAVPEFENINGFMRGTLVNITLKCDERYYVLAEEISPEDTLF